MSEASPSSFRSVPRTGVIYVISEAAKLGYKASDPAWSNLGQGMPETSYAFSAEALRKEIAGRGLGALLLSNPSNPTGKVISGAELERWVDTARKLDCATIFDEFYSHYVWNGDGSPVSAAHYVEDV